MQPLDWMTAETLFGSSVLQAPLVEDRQTETPTQVILIDWLECLRSAYTDIVSGSFRPRIGIVVSAWDLVPTDRQNLGPSQYLNTEFPMFMQYLESNSDLFDIAIFGVSIVGGDFQTEAGFRDRYLQGNPFQSGYVIHSLNNGLERSSDITLPVVWAMGWEVKPRI